ncbi:helix-turn-helix domain-containing protein [Pseudomonas putida]
MSERLARFPVGQLPGTPDGLTICLRQEDIAAELNVTREAVAIALRKFRRNGLIETGYRSITVVNIPALQDACE